MRDRFFHYPRTFNDLRQKHLSRAKEIAHHVHAIHQGPFNDLDRMIKFQARRLRVLHNELIESLDEGMFQSLGNRPSTPLKIDLPLGCTAAFKALGHRQQALRALGRTI